MHFYFSFHQRKFVRDDTEKAMEKGLLYENFRKWVNELYPGGQLSEVVWKKIMQEDTLLAAGDASVYSPRNTNAQGSSDSSDVSFSPESNMF